MEYIFYVNGIQIKPEDFKKIIITNPTILEIIDKVKKRISQQSTFIENNS